MPNRPAGSVNRICTTTLLSLATTLAMSAEIPSPQPANAQPQAWVEELRAANHARASLAAEVNAWRQEKERLQAVIAGVDAERERLAKDAEDAERLAKAAGDELKAFSTGSDLDALRSQLSAGALTAKAALARLAAQLPPGTLRVAGNGGDASFDDLARTLDDAERAATSIAVDVVPGSVAGQTVAVKLLRVAGACAWWVSLDGSQAGVATVIDGALTLTPARDETQRAAIVKALAIVEGRLPAAMVVLPLQPIALESAP